MDITVSAQKVEIEVAYTLTPPHLADDRLVRVGAISVYGKIKVDFPGLKKNDLVPAKITSPEHEYNWKPTPEADKKIMRPFWRRAFQEAKAVISHHRKSFPGWDCRIELKTNLRDPIYGIQSYSSDTRIRK
ncbi:MAG: hypothetical protein WC528_01835 [Patescibacteria group bacterium]